MLQWLRSLVFTVLLFLTTLAFGVAVLISAMLPLSIEQRYVIPRYWGLFLTWLAKVICGIDYVIEGRERLPAVPFISLWKHSSAWETLAQMFVVPPASWLLKREVLWIPVVGWAVKTYKPIAIDRRAGHSAVNQVVKQGRDRLAAGMGVVVYPEGTRMPPGQTRKYGVSGALLAVETGAPIVPIAHNSAYLWRRRSLLKKAGTIYLVIGEPIDPAGRDSIHDIGGLDLDGLQVVRNAVDRMVQILGSLALEHLKGVLTGGRDAEIQHDAGGNEDQGRERDDADAQRHATGEKSGALVLRFGRRYWYSCHLGPHSISPTL